MAMGDPVLSVFSRYQMEHSVTYYPFEIYLVYADFAFKSSGEDELEMASA